jgi:type I restriction enzyme S subunit
MPAEADISLPVIGKLPRGWRAVEFGAVLNNGTRNGIYKPKEFHGRGAKMINMGELFRYPRLRDVQMRRVELDEEERNRFSIAPGDLLFARRSLVAEGAGKCSIVMEAKEPTTFESSIIRARPDSREADSLFLFYLFNSPFGAHALDTILRHVAVAGITGTDLVKLVIPLPPVSEQQSIGRILGALDDKIELNRRMNETLEALAQSLFKSWFVDTTKDGLPKGWSIGSILSHAKLLSGGTPKTDRQEYWDGDILWASAKDVSQCGQTFLVSTERSITKKGLDESATQMIPAFCTVVVARGATTGRMVMFGREMAMNQTCYALLSTTGTPFALYCQLRHEIDNLVHTAHGSVFDTITTSTFASSRVVLPPKQMLEEFERTVSPIFRRTLVNIQESRTLAALRDALLPKLSSGQVRLKTVAVA